MYDDGDSWVTNKVEPNIRRFININGDYIKGMQSWDTFMMDSIRHNTSDDKDALLDAFNYEYTLMNEVFLANITVFLVKPEYRSWYGQQYLRFPFVVLQATKPIIKVNGDNWLNDNALSLDCINFDHINNHWHCNNQGVEVKHVMPILATHLSLVGNVFQRCTHKFLVQYDTNHDQSIDPNQCLRLTSHQQLQGKYQQCLLEKINAMQECIVKQLKLNVTSMRKCQVRINAGIVNDLELLFMDRLRKYIARNAKQVIDFHIKWHRCARWDYLKISHQAAVKPSFRLMFQDQLRKTIKNFNVCGRQYSMKIDKKNNVLVVLFRIQFKAIVATT